MELQLDQTKRERLHIAFRGTSERTNEKCIEHEPQGKSLKREEDAFAFSETRSPTRKVSNLIHFGALFDTPFEAK